VVQFRAFINCCLAEYHYGRRTTVLGNKPRVFAIELTNYCNLACSACPRSSMTRKVGFMDFSLFKGIISQLKGHVGFLWLHNFGEPLFHPEIGRFIGYCSENNIRTGLSTNATVLDEDKASMLLDSGLDHIVLAIDGATSATYQRMRHGGDFENVRKNIEYFLNLKKRLGRASPFAEVQMIKMDETGDEIDAFRRRWGDLADNVFIKDFCAWGDQVAAIAGLKEKKPAYYSRRRKRLPCMALWRDGIVLWNGDLVLCCMDYDGKMVLGNLNKEKLKDIWNSEAVRKLRKEHSDNNYDNPLCKECSEWSGPQADIHFLSLKVLPYLKRLSRKARCSKI